MAIPDFVRTLRGVVGSDHLLWLPGVNAVVTNAEEEVLLHRRKEDGLWSILSGIIEPGESPKSAVMREVEEETGVEVEVERLTSVTVSPQRRHSNGDIAQYLELTFRCVSMSGDAHINDDESIDVQWFPQDMLPPLEPFVLPRVLHALKGTDEVMFADSTGAQE